MSDAVAKSDRESDGPADARAEEALRELATFFDAVAAHERQQRRGTSTYHRLVQGIHHSIVAAGARVLEIGCGCGDLLAAVRPSYGVGIDISPEMIAAAGARHPELEFAVAAGESFISEETFDYVILSDVVPFAHDLLALFNNIGRMTDRRSRVIVHSYSQLWRPVIRVAELLGVKQRLPVRNWVNAGDVENLLALADFEVVTRTRRILLPVLPLLSTLFNGVLASVPPFSWFCLTYWVVARPRPQPGEGDVSVSVVVPARNEAGTIAEIVERVAELGSGTELIFVEGGSTDDTCNEIKRQIELHPERRIALYQQSGRGKADAVRLGFDQAQGDILSILDADLSVAPEDLMSFYDAVVSGRADLANGSRLVYGQEPGAMQSLNVFGNKFFSWVFSWLMDQPVKDTLCGTKVLWRSDYERIAAGRKELGDLDPFGDFDLLLGAARLQLKIVDVPIRYGARTYGSTNISRFRHGLLLLKMAGVGFRKLKVAPVRL